MATSALFIAVICLTVLEVSLYDPYIRCPKVCARNYCSVQAKRADGWGGWIYKTFPNACMMINENECYNGKWQFEDDNKLDYRGRLCKRHGLGHV